LTVFLFCFPKIPLIPLFDVLLESRISLSTLLVLDNYAATGIGVRFSSMLTSYLVLLLKPRAALRNSLLRTSSIHSYHLKKWGYSFIAYLYKYVVSIWQMVFMCGEFSFMLWHVRLKNSYNGSRFSIDSYSILSFLLSSSSEKAPSSSSTSPPKSNFLDLALVVWGIFF
jgi:hypothetical protein